jgi:predicted anti-sigma-YlaC factor YlaD
MAVENMTCREFVECVGAYHDGDVATHQQSAFAAHFAECLACRAYLGAYEAATRLARTAMKTSDEHLSDTLPEVLVKSILKLRGRKK